MGLNENDLKKGLKFLVGTWELDFIVNTCSPNLAHIPAKEFKNQDGKDLSQITFEFFEDHTGKVKNGATGVEESSTWRQTGSTTYEYTFDKLFGDFDPATKKNMQKMEKNFEGVLVINIGFLIAGLKKTAEGVVTEAKKLDIGEMEPSAADLEMKAIVGRYKIYKALSLVGGNFGMYTRAEVEAEFAKKEAAGEKINERRRQEELEVFNALMEFAEDHKVYNLMPITPDMSKEDIDKEVKSGEFELVDGMLRDTESKKWKAVNGDYWYDTEEQAEVCGEKASSWIKIKPDSDGRIDLKIFVLEKM